MTLSALLLSLAKVTAILTVALLCLVPMRRTSAALRHLICAAALAAALLIPVLPKISPASIPVQMPVGVEFSVTGTGAPVTAWRASTILLAIWFAGTLLLLVRTIAGYLRLANMLRGAENCGTAGEVQIVSADTGVPFVSGLLRPLIALPETWPDEFREAAIRHELAHVQRHDLWTELLARLTCAFYWFHPLVWLTAARLRYEREAACDDAVLHSGFDAPSYAEALVAAARRAANSPLLGCSMINRTNLKSRTARLLDSSLPRMASTSTLIRTAIACAVVFAAIGVLIPVRAQAPAEPATTAQSATSAPARGPVDDPKPEVYPVGGDVSSPSVASREQPPYPDDMRDLKISGTVRLELVVGADGLAHDINVVSSPADGLSQAAIESVQQWRFVPGQKNGEPVSVKATIEVNFRLQ